MNNGVILPVEDNPDGVRLPLRAFETLVTAAGRLGLSWLLLNEPPAEGRP